MPFVTVLKKRTVIFMAVALWLPAVSFGFWVLCWYSSAPGRPATPPLEWPAGAPIPRTRERATLLIFAHPQCPCSRASIGELAVIMARSIEKPDTHVFFYLPAAQAGGWVKTDLWRSATAIPGVHAVEDRDGASARLFGASTSGQALLYDRRGHLVFGGGITAFRGHSGGSYGRDAILALLRNGDPERHTAPVFGCSLRGE